jgi:hypothetical protein
MPREERPADNEYYEAERVKLLSQGDIFADVPLTYPGVGAEVAEVVGRRYFLSGPLETGFAMLITPTCSMRAQEAEGYAHPVRTLVPILSIDLLMSANVITKDSRGLAEKYDDLYNYMFLPAHSHSKMPVSMALLYMPVTISHALLEATATRVTQLALEGARQLQRKLVLYASSAPIERARFKPPMD